MDILLEDKLDEIKTRLINNFFSNDTKYKFTDKNKSLLQGDWSRKYRNNRLSLDKFMGKEVMKEVIFNSIKDELKIKSKIGDYAMNFNPNWFFIFYKEFYDEKIFDFIPIKNENDEIRGIEFIDSNIRKEIYKIIEIHSRFLLNDNLRQNLGSSNFTKYFMDNCYIQHKIRDNMWKNNYIDLCYIIEDNNLLLEINEPHHHELVDFTRSINILISSDSRLVNYNINDCYINNEIVYKNLIKSLCKIIYKKNKKTESIKLFLTEINNMPFRYVDFGVSLYKNEYNLKLYELAKLPFLSIDIDKIIKSIVKKGNINILQDFTKKYNKELTVENLIKDKDTIELTSYGIKNFLLSIDGKKWPERIEYIEFMVELENEYYKVVEEIIKDDDYGILQKECCTLKNIFGLMNYDQDQFFTKAKQVKNFKTKLHKSVPFIIRTDDREYIDYDLLSNIFNKNIKENININEFSESRYITNYRLLYPTELEQIYDNDFK